MVVGAGVVGLSIARLLTMYEGLEVHIVEKEADVGWGASRANTALLHAGYDDDPDRYPVRASLCRAGNEMWRRWLRELEVPVRWCGSLVAAIEDHQVDHIYELLERGRRNGVPGLAFLDGDEARRLEPLLSERVRAALWAPTAGVVAVHELLYALAENVVDNGAVIHLRTRVTGIRVENGEVKGVETSRGFIEAEWVINAAGLYADEVSRMAGIDKFEIKPRRGQYILFDKSAEPKPRRIIFPTPTPKTKGVVVVTTTEGNLMLGPTAEDLPIWAKEDYSTSREGLEYVMKEASKLVKQLPPRTAVIRTFAGLRPEPTGSDFIIEAYDDPRGFVNAAGMRSPGLTASPAVAAKVIGLMGELGLRLERRSDWRPCRRRARRPSELSFEEWDKMIGMNANYGRIVCLCEKVTEAEILEAIRRGATTLDGVKYRTRAMAGRCQGAFCRLKVALILARELGVPLWRVTVKGVGSELGLGHIKVLLGEGGDEED